MHKGDLNMEDVKEILEKQLQLLSEVSENLRRSDYPARDLTKLSVAMTGIASLLLQKNQSFYEASTSHPYVVQLPAKDLVDLYAARAQLLHRRGASHRT